MGNVLVIVGWIIGGTSHSMSQSIAGRSILGVGSGFCQLAIFALPELLPNRWRHIGIVIADSGVVVDITMGPVVARIAYENGAVFMKILTLDGRIH